MVKGGETIEIELIKVIVLLQGRVLFLLLWMIIQCVFTYSYFGTGLYSSMVLILPIIK